MNYIHKHLDNLIFGDYKIIEIAYRDCNNLPWYKCFCEKCNHYINLNRRYILNYIIYNGRCNCESVLKKRKVMKINP